MSNVMIDDESSRLKQFIWEELDEHFFIAVLFRSDRRYVVQRHFEQQLVNIKSSLIQNKWRHCLLDVISRSLSPIYITYNEVELMHEIFSWHLNYANKFIKLRENIDYVIDFEDLITCSHSITLVDSPSENCKSFILQPVTTLDAARKNIEMWKTLQETTTDEQITNQTIDKRVNRKRTQTPILTSTESSPLCDQSFSTGWLQLDSKIVAFIKKQCDRLIPVDYLLKEHIISSSEDFSLRPLYIPVDKNDICIFNTLVRQSSSSISNSILTNHSSLITLDHLIFRLKRLFFVRFLFSPSSIDLLDYHKIMSFHGGLLTIRDSQQQQQQQQPRIPFIYVNKTKYIPQMNNQNFPSISTFCMANTYELEYLRLVSLYDYLSSDDNNHHFLNLSTVTNLTLIPIDCYYDEKLQTVLLLSDFHYHEYQRRIQQQKNTDFHDDNQQLSSGWWQPPVSSSSKQKKPLPHFKLQRPIFF